MTQKLAAILDLKPNDDVNPSTNLFEEADQVMVALKNSEKIDSALESVVGLNQHDTEMDQIADLALKSYRDLVNLGMSCSEMNAGKVFEVAGQMLKTALDAKESKVTRKLKTVDLMLKKEKIEKYVQSKTKKDDLFDDMTSTAMDRNDILDMLKQRSIDVVSTDIPCEKVNTTIQEGTENGV